MKEFMEEYGIIFFLCLFFAIIIPTFLIIMKMGSEGKLDGDVKPNI